MNSNLANYDIAILIDRSGSMGEGHKHTTKWGYAQEATEAIAREAAKYDADGVTVGFFNNSVKLFTNTTPDKVAQVFAEVGPSGGTATDEALKAVLTPDFFGRLSGGGKPAILLVITDGAPNDATAVKQVIIDATTKITKDEDLAISFVQVGNDAGATAFLKDLDDNLQAQGALFDIVDTKNIDDIDTFEQLLTQALDD